MPPPPEATAPHGYDELLTIALGYARAGAGRRAAAAASQAVAHSPDRPEAYIVWGHALAQQRQLGPSAEKYEQARRLGSRDATLFAELASVYDVSGRYDDAIDVYIDFLADHPAHAEMRQQLALTLLLRNRKEEAVTHLKEAVSQHPTNLQLRQDLGYALLQAGQPEQAVTELETVAEADPRRTDAMRFAARAHGALGNAERALGWLNQILDRNDQDLEALRMRARLKVHTGDRDGALADYGQLAAQVPDDARRVWDELAAVARKVGNAKLARQAEARAKKAAEAGRR